MSPRPARHARPGSNREGVITASTATTALVGGGASGIGRATAEHLAHDGWDVVLVGRTEERLRATASELTAKNGRDVRWAVGDLGDADAADDLVADVEDRFGELAVLVLNTGGPRPARILDLDADDWRDGAELLLVGPLAVARNVVVGMQERGFGRVVLVTGTAVRQPMPELALSTVLRSAATAAMKLLAGEVAADGVTVNCVAPGPVATDRRAQIVANRAATAGVSTEQADADDLAVVPAGRAGEPGEVAAAIAFLASRDAGYVTGTVLTVDGGRTETTW
ncbi:SDR family oxidoreductase [Actinomycetospora chlora]|uniref:SDR family oxidoreductase n=1 Tax=Actinomycetospora chlora TaxID=663608 RepID=UPI003CD095B0